MFGGEVEYNTVSEFILSTSFSVMILIGSCSMSYIFHGDRHSLVSSCIIRECILSVGFRALLRARQLVP